MTIEEKIERAAQLLADAARGPAKVILFGSHARGDARRGSDLDFLVIERDLEAGFEESVRLRSALRGLRTPIDVIAVSEQEADDWGEVENTVVHAALTEGRVVAET